MAETWIKPKEKRQNVHLDLQVLHRPTMEAKAIELNTMITKLN